ncbi:hypothetical protein COO59_02660 [Mixta theicola]|uniref:TumA n=1 Tax=Mixta theicola TaxID=1458355 RepID=A0A2K1QCU1_9GAMM|nr:hypothetical protein [Mixta theicola]PNS12840.1 hypothetical protein COO59_02660 [Mixta theicola]GLR09088.1 hypothetical protein GCM10007905_18080 [Mixta theicola]
MQLDDLNAMHKKMACVRFIAEISLIANCKPTDFELALTIIADLTNSEPRNEDSDGLFYSAN